jgi:flagellar biosynthesis protein FlhG
VDPADTTADTSTDGAAEPPIVDHVAGRGARRIIAVGGGKGGVGKSLLAANIGIYLTTLGKRVVLLDADLGGANLHTFVGVERPRVTLGDLFEKRVAKIEDVVVETAVAGLGLVSGEGDPSWMANPRPAQKHRLINQVQQLPVDYLVVDLGPGSGFNAIDFFLVADVGLLVVVPEPTSVENTYRFLKSAFLRRLRRAGLETLLEKVNAKEGDHAFEGGIPGPYDLYAAAKEKDPALAEQLAAEVARFRPRIVVNQARSPSDLALGPSLVSAARRRLGMPVDYLGPLEQDDAAWLAVRKRRPLLVEQPESRAAKGIERVVRRLLAMETEKPTSVPLRPESDLTHYDLLEIDPAATDEEIRRAYRRVRELYGPDSLVTPGLYGKDRIAALLLRIDEAYETLMEADRRRAYDLKLFPDEQPIRARAATPLPAPLQPSGPIAMDVPAPSSSEEPAKPTAEPAPPPAPLPPEPPIGPTTTFTGALLRQLREARGIDIHQIAQKTKIGVGHLRAIEDERFDMMPAFVYVRGFLVEYARFMRLDVNRVLSTYLDRFRAARADADRDA